MIYFVVTTACDAQSFERQTTGGLWVVGTRWQGVLNLLLCVVDRTDAEFDRNENAQSPVGAVNVGCQWG
jgi:hypothetical protein